MRTSLTFISLTWLFLVTVAHGATLSELWEAKNPWFGNNKQMTDFAFDVHHDLISEGSVSAGSRAYYDALDDRMRSKFPKYFDNPPLPLCSDKIRGQRCQGSVTLSDGSEYLGEMLFDKPDGNGRLVTSNGTILLGQFKDGLMHGHGSMEVPDKWKYEGEWQNGQKHGFGTEKYSDGSYYEGDWQKGQKHGWGKIYNKLLDAHGEGQWVRGRSENASDKAIAWWKNNQWFNKDKEMTEAAAEIHKTLISRGVDPESDEYYEAIDRYVQRLFPQSRFKKYVADKGQTETTSATATQPNTSSSAELEAERKKRIKLEQQLAAMKAEQQQQQQTILDDTILPTITIASATTKGAQGVIRGRVSDNTGIAELRVDGQKIAVDGNGNFSATTYVPEGGTNVNIEAVDLAGLSSAMSVRVDRATTQTAAITFDRLNPLKRKAQSNKDAIALVVGISKYENIIDAAFADKDALVFRDYATEKLGIPESRIRTLINEEADIGEVLLGIRKWIRRSTKPGKTDVYVFYAGHGIATASGEAYILPYDSRPEIDLLDRTALLQKELFAEIDKAKPRNVTIFLDACYTGKARTGEVLMADANYRPIAIRPIDDGMPDNFTLITASSGDEFSGPLEEAKHGMFSYFLMKGMEGDADSNQDNQITSGELHEYVKENVLRQSADKQTPELQGDADRVLVRFQ